MNKLRRERYLNQKHQMKIQNQITCIFSSLAVEYSRNYLEFYLYFLVDIFDSNLLCESMSCYNYYIYTQVLGQLKEVKS